MRNEIGSEYWNVPIYKNKESSFFQNKIKWFMSGRVALHYIINDIKLNRKLEMVALPSWCCESIIQPFQFYNIKVEFYPIVLSKEKGIIQELDNIVNCDAILVMDYFGYQNLQHFKFKGIVICDVTHSIFTDYHRQSDYIFGSLRKWAGFYTCGFAYCKNGFKNNIAIENDRVFSDLRRQAMSLKTKFISCSLEDKRYLSVFAKAEEYLDYVSSNGKIFAADERDVKLVECFDISLIKTKRRENAKVLSEQLSNITLFENVSEKDCPMFVPIILPNNIRNNLQKYLISKQIYCPVHWPISHRHSINKKSKEIYDCELSIVCDHRYDVNDMERVCEEIRNYLFV